MRAITEAYCGDTELELTAKKEFELLRVSWKIQAGYSRDSGCSISCRGEWTISGMSALSIHIKNLRKKLDRDVIHTVRGVGYRLEKKGEEKA